MTSEAEKGRIRKSGAAKPVDQVSAVEVSEPIEAPVAEPAAAKPRLVAAPDMAGLTAAQRAFADAVMQGQKRNTMLAAGAAGGAAVALVLAGMVYVQSVGDLRVAATVQTEAAKLLVEEVKQFDGIGDVVAEQQDVMKTELLETLELVKDEIRRAAMAGPEPAPEAEPMDAQIATAIRDGVKADMGAMRDEILTALAEVEMALANGTADPAMAELVEGVKVLVAASAPPEPTAKPADRGPTGATERPAKPRAKPQPAEPNPFTYP
jgi:hypothetical protein